MKLGYQVESSEIYVRRDPLDHETFFGHHKITRAPQYSSLRPVITVLPQTLEWTRTSKKRRSFDPQFSQWCPKKRSRCCGKVIFEAVGVSGVVDITGILVGGALWLERQDPDKCAYAFCSCGSKAKTWGSFKFVNFNEKEDVYQTLDLTLQQVLLPCPFRRCRQNFSSCTFHELGAASSFVT